MNKNTGYHLNIRRIAAATTLALALPGTAMAATPFTFITNWYAQAEHGGFYEAQAEGLYKQAGLDVTIKMGGPQVNSLQLLGAGRGDCAIGSDISVINARARDLPVEMVATTFQHDPTVIIAHNDVKSLADLKTRTLLVSSEANTSWMPWAKQKFGYKDSQIRPYTFNIQPFIADKNVAQQGYLTSEPFALEKAGVPVKVFPISDAGFPAYGNVIVCRTAAVEKQPELVSAFLKASMQGWKDYLVKPAAGNKLIIKDNPNMTQAQIDYSIAKFKAIGSVTGEDAATHGIGIITAPRVKATWTMARDLKLVEGKMPALDSVYTTKLIDKVKVMP